MMVYLCCIRNNVLHSCKEFKERNWNGWLSIFVRIPCNELYMFLVAPNKNSSKTPQELLCELLNIFVASLVLWNYSLTSLSLSTTFFIILLRHLRAPTRQDVIYPRHTILNARYHFPFRFSTVFSSSFFLFFLLVIKLKWINFNNSASSLGIHKRLSSLLLSSQLYFSSSPWFCILRGRRAAKRKGNLKR